MDRLECFILSRTKLYPKFAKIQSGKQSHCYHHYISVNCSYFDTPIAMYIHTVQDMNPLQLGVGGEVLETLEVVYFLGAELF